MPSDLDTAGLAELITRFGELLDRQDAALLRVTVQTITGAGPHALTEAAHGGKRLRIGNGGATATIQVTLPASAAVGTVFLPRQIGGGPLKFVPATGATLAPSQTGHNGTSGANAPVTLTCEANADGASAVWLLDGFTAIVA